MQIISVFLWQYFEFDRNYLAHVYIYFDSIIYHILPGAFTTLYR